MVRIISDMPASELASLVSDLIENDRGHSFNVCTVFELIYEVLPHMDKTLVRENKDLLCLLIKAQFLIDSCYEFDDELLDLIKANMFDITARSLECGETPLMLALKYGKFDIFKFIADKVELSDEEKAHKDEKGKTMWDYYREHEVEFNEVCTEADDFKETDLVELERLKNKIRLV